MYYNYGNYRENTEAACRKGICGVRTEHSMGRLDGFGETF
jgi:hypothetical protein